ncbi:MAG: DNA polymerase III subunit epsilon [Candidatus Sedimenticola sp. 20ELBAFRAG]
MRQIVLDTETTGLEPEQGHRIIEIGCVEMVERRLTGNNFHQYLQPDREIDQAAVEVHGITNQFLEDKPRFGDVVGDFIEYIKGAELVIHNAPFDVGFINHELRELGGWDEVGAICSVIDTLVMAKKMHPGQRNSLDALCKRYDINNSHRELHGALLDAEILADVYLAMTGGQTNLLLGGGADDGEGGDNVAIRRIEGDRPDMRIVRAQGEELDAHEARLDALDKAAGGSCVWRGSE